MVSLALFAQTVFAPPTLGQTAASPAQAQTVERVGRGEGGRSVTPVNQVVTPHGAQVELPGMRPQTLALSPDGRLLVTSGKTHELVVVDAATGRIRQRVVLPSDSLMEPQPPVASANILEPDTDGQVSFTGLVFSPDGARIFLSNVNGSLKVFAVGKDGSVTPSHSIALPRANAPRRKEEIPSGLAFSADGERLYVALNLSNRLAELEASSGRVLRIWNVGVAPYDVAITGGKAYVSNWGGRRPMPGDVTGPAGRGTEVRVDPVRHIASEGSVSVIDLRGGRPAAEILTGLHASALAVSPNRRSVVCANAGSDNLSVIDTRSDRVIETIWVKQSPSDIFGASPNALAFEANGRRLYVANGTQNAVAVVDFKPGKSVLRGLVPVGWYPGALVYDARRRSVYAANIKGIPSVKGRDRQSGGEGFNSHQYSGSLSLFRVPANRELGGLSAIVWRNYRREQLAVARLPARPNQPARPVPERIGEPSVFKHVVYVIKENRTYDQVLGDMSEGNGDPSLCVFGEKITPNQHKIAREFVLLDNTYCSGILSADGHQWSTTAFSTDYMEKSFAGFPRSYPDGMGPDENDALAYSPAGFIWDNVIRHGRSIWNFGEFAMPASRWADPQRKGEPAWIDFWNEYLHGRGEVVIGSQPSIESIRSYTPTNTVGWIMEVPDVWRARYITNQIAAWEKQGSLPNLILICLPNDHTSGTSAGSPTPAACVADNDLAFGQIVEAFSKSRFWKETVIFGIEDDPQNGWDHVSGYRTTAYCVSPYTKRRAVVSTQYNTTSILRTIEQILGLAPMNQFDATATPMFDCFGSEPDFTPFTAVANTVPLDEMNPNPKAIHDPLLRKHAYASARLNFKQIDACPEGLLNRILWHAMKGSAAQFPSWAITAGAADEDDD
jgi:YVTN family beta-propeller protein